MSRRAAARKWGSRQVVKELAERGFIIHSPSMRAGSRRKLPAPTRTLGRDWTRPELRIYRLVAPTAKF